MAPPEKGTQAELRCANCRDRRPSLRPTLVAVVHGWAILAPIRLGKAAALGSARQGLWWRKVEPFDGSVTLTCRRCKQASRIRCERLWRLPAGSVCYISPKTLTIAPAARALAPPSQAV